MKTIEVIRVVSPKCIEVREMDHEQTVFPKQFFPGGFCGHYADNHAQDYTYSSNPTNPVNRIRLGKKGWGNGQFRMSDTPCYFYDYNF